MLIAATTSSHSGGSSPILLIFIVLFVLLYLVVIRPQRKKQSKQRQHLSDLRVGDEILTAGGVYGRVTRLDDDDVRLEIAKSVEVRVARRAVAAILTEHSEPDTPAEPQEGDDERWQSAFGEGSGEDKPG